MTTDKHQRTIDRMRITMRAACMMVSRAGASEDDALRVAQQAERWPECPTEGAGERG